MKKLIILNILLIILSSCVSQINMSKALNSTYLKKEITNYSKLNIEEEKRIIIQSTNINGIDSIPKIIEHKSLFVPLLFFNFWNFQYDGKIGYSNLSENLHYNMKENILEYNFKMDSLKVLNQSRLTITIDSIKSNILYVNKGFLIFIIYNYSMFSKDYIMPTELTISFSYKIENSNGSIKTGAITRTENIPLKNNKNMLFKNFIHDYNDDYLIELKKLLKKACYEISDELIQVGK